MLITSPEAKLLGWLALLAPPATSERLGVMLTLEVFLVQTACLQANTIAKYIRRKGVQFHALSTTPSPSADVPALPHPSIRAHNHYNLCRVLEACWKSLTRDSLMRKTRVEWELILIY